MDEWTPAEEARRLKARFVGINQADFARTHQIAGGPSMVNQHINGHRSIGLAAAIKYAKAFGVPLAEISPRQARLYAAVNAESAPAPAVKAAEPPSPPYGYVDRHEVSESDWALLKAVQVVMTDEERAEMVRRAEKLREQVREIEAAVKK